MVILVTLIFSAYFIYTFSNQIPKKIETSASELRAVIVDHLSLTSPNQTFVDTTTNTLRQAGYAVDYYPGKNVTVEFFRTLASHKYKLVILRVHSTAVAYVEGGFSNAPVTIFTAEEYSQNRYLWEQLTGQIVGASYPVPQSPSYFAITPRFVTSSMRGMFNNSIVIMMGCEGLNNTHMAEAFVERGASVYIGWNKSPRVTDTDSATSCLLKHLLVQKETLDTAVQTAMETMSKLPETQQLLLLYYPQNAGEGKIEAILNI